MKRPLGVTITAILMGLNVVADVLQAFTTRSMDSPHAHPPHSPLSAVMIIVHVGLAAMILLEVVSVWFYWRGRNWARWFVIAGCIFYLTGLRYLKSQWTHSHLVAFMTVGGALLALYLLWYLHTRNVREWFADSATELAYR